jgi:hypothetical protein
MAARRAALAAARAAARSACDLDRPGRPDRSRADPAGEDVTELDSIPAGRIDQEGPYCITDFRAVPFRQRQPILGLPARPASRSAGLMGSAPGSRQRCDPDPNRLTCSFCHSNEGESIASLVIVNLTWWIWASWLIRGSIVHQNNHVAPINHDLFGEGCTSHALTHHQVRGVTPRWSRVQAEGEGGLGGGCRAACARRRAAGPRCRWPGTRSRARPTRGS